MIRIRYIDPFNEKLEMGTIDADRIRFFGKYAVIISGEKEIPVPMVNIDQITSVFLQLDQEVEESQFGGDFNPVLCTKCGNRTGFYVVKSVDDFMYDYHCGECDHQMGMVDETLRRSLIEEGVL